MHENFILDEADLRLLRALDSGRELSNVAIAEAVGLSASQVSRRRSRLEELGVIKRYVAEIDPERLGLSVKAFVHLTLTKHGADNAQRLKALVARTPSILEAHAVTGENDYLLKVVVKNLKEFAVFISETLLAQEFVARVRSEIVLETLKSEPAIALLRWSSPFTSKTL